MSRDRSSPEEEEGGLSAAGLSAAGLTESAWRAFAAARAGLGQAVPAWGDLDDDYRVPFAQAVATARDLVLGAPDDGFSASDAACQSLIVFQKAAGVEPAPDARARIAFEAVVRHVVNALCWDEEDHGDLADHESAWGEWAAKKSSNLEGVR